MDKKDEETHAMDKPKPLEVVSDGDLSEVKKDPEETKKAWEVWLEKTRGDDWDAEDKEHEEMSRPIKCTSCGKTKPRILYENPLGKPKGICDECYSPPADGAPEPKWITDMQNDDDTDENPKTSKKAWEVWLEKKEIHISDLEEGGDGIYRPDVELEAGKKKKRKKQGERVSQENRNRRAYVKYGEGRWKIPDENPKTSDKSYVTKPIPDSKGGRGSFQHCINANKDKKNPGGWCKQIERKIGKGKDEGEEEEVKISTYKKLTRIKDRLQAHNKAKKQTRIDRKGEWFDPSKIGTNTGWDDNPMNKPSYFFAVMREEEERKKKEKKKAGEDKTDDVVSTVKRRKRLEDYFEARATRMTLFNSSEKKKIAEKPESDYYMDAGGNPQQKEKAEKDCPLCDDKKNLSRKERWLHEDDLDEYTAKMLALHKKDPDAFHANISSPTPKEQEELDNRMKDPGDDEKLKADYFVEEIRSNIIYHNKILPILGMIAGQAARGIGGAAKKIGPKLLSDVGAVGQDMLQQDQEEEEQ